MALRLLWERRVPDNCGVEAVSRRSEWLVLRLYCREDMRELKIDSGSGRTSVRILGEPELRGWVEWRREFHTLRCVRGYGVQAWNKLVRALSVRMVCRKDICVAAYMKPHNNVEIDILGRNGAALETVNLGNILDYQLQATDNLIVFTALGVDESFTTTMLIDASTASIIDDIPGFGGLVVTSPELAFVAGEHEGRIYTRGFSNDGEEILVDEGLPILVPTNPYPHMVPGGEFRSPEQLVIMDRHSLKVYNIYDYTMEYTVMRPPRTRGVFDISPDAGSVTTLSIHGDSPVIANYGFQGEVRWMSHIVRGVTRVLHGASLVAVYDGAWRRETRIYRIRPPGLGLETVLSPRVEPLLIRGNTVIVFDGYTVAAYELAEE